MADVKGLQEKVAKSGKALAHNHDPKDILLSVMEELREVVRAYLKEVGLKNGNCEVKESLTQELGDFFYMGLRLANVAGLDLEKRKVNLLYVDLVGSRGFFL